MRELADVTAMQILLVAIESLLLYVRFTFLIPILVVTGIFPSQADRPAQFILIAIYRLTFHPLAKYPGPLLGRLTGWSIVFQAASGDRHLRSWKEHEVYGPPIQLPPGRQ